jgi:hypothetical protein
MYAYAGESLVYELSGYYDPLPFELNRSANSSYWRRSERFGWAYGASIGGRLSGLDWVGFAQIEGSTEIQYKNAYDNDPPTDDWNSDGWTLGFAGQRRACEGRVLVTVSGRYTKLDGDAVRMDLGEVNFSVTESAANLRGEIRLLPRSGWNLALVAGLGREHRLHRDILARVGSDLSHWAPAVAVEIARSLANGFAVSAAAGMSRYSPRGEIPTPERMSQAYQTWIAPEYALYGTEANSRTGALTLLWRARAGLSLWAAGKLASLSPTSGNVQFQDTPEGSRTRTRIEVGVTLGGAER